MEQNKLAHASFTISGDKVIPDFWTEYFEIQPDMARRKGDPFTTKHGRVIQTWTGVWGVQSKREIRSDALEPHLRYLIQHLALPRSDLRSLIENVGAKMRFFCYWSNETGDRIPDVPEDIQAMMDALGGIVEIDEYR